MHTWIYSRKYKLASERTGQVTEQMSTTCKMRCHFALESRRMCRHASWVSHVFRVCSVTSSACTRAASHAMMLTIFPFLHDGGHHVVPFISQRHQLAVGHVRFAGAVGLCFTKEQRLQQRLGHCLHLSTYGCGLQHGQPHTYGLCASAQLTRMRLCKTTENPSPIGVLRTARPHEASGPKTG